MTVWYNPRFDLIGLGHWGFEAFHPESKVIQIDIAPSNNSGRCYAWGRARTAKEWKKVDWVLIGEY